MDARCPRSYCPSHNTFLKIQIQSFINFSHFEESKLKDPKLAPLCDNATELAKKKDKKNKKKSFQSQRREHIKKQKEQTLATGVNIIEAGLKKKTPTSYVTILIKKVIIQNFVQNLQKTSVGLGNLCAGD